VLDLLLVLVTRLGTKNLTSKRLIMLLGFSLGLLLILMVLCIIGIMIMLLLGLSCVD
jgi:hypothetical protein